MEAKAWQGESGNSWGGATSTTAHHNTWTYDAAGNTCAERRRSILTQMRNKQDGDTLDNLTYHYGTGLKRNQLGYIDDAITTTPPAVTGELEDQAAGNYVYDAIGNLIADVRDSIGTASVPGIEWDVRGKITKVTKIKNGKTIVIEYAYDALGQRIRKTVKTGLNENTWQHTYYVRDAQGNALAVYSSALVQSGSQYTATLKVQEYTLYGASRLGTHAIDLTVSTRVWTGGSYNATTGAYSRPGTPTGTGPLNFPATGYISLVRGQKRYELSNHLGNVLAVISDRKLQNTTTWNTSKVYLPDVRSYTDYYAFGWEMPGRSSGSYRYGFNGQEEEPEFWGGAVSFEYRVEDARVGRFFSVDPIAADYPWYTPYQVAGNMMIMARELEGLEPWYSILPYNEQEYNFAHGAKEIDGSPDAYGPYELDVAEGMGYVVDLDTDVFSREYIELCPMCGNVVTGLQLMPANISLRLFSSNNTVIIGLTAEQIEKVQQDQMNSVDAIARRILNNQNVTYQQIHASGVNDDANPRDNLLQVANGQRMATSTYGHAEGQTTDISMELLSKFETLAQEFKIQLSEIAGGKHTSKNSLHYKGKAMDITEINGVHVWNTKESKAQWKPFEKRAKELGLKVNAEGNHLHLYVEGARRFGNLENRTKSKK